MIYVNLGEMLYVVHVHKNKCKIGTVFTILTQIVYFEFHKVFKSGVTGVM